ncbi:MAG TPA: hypothetical protein IAC02_04150 [Candidatus Coprovivens excrementavium]|nr:hypothetical protein [Candidatus Coprovivens excrementavium]
MNEEINLKPLKNETPELKKIELPQTQEQNSNQTTEEKILNNLPTWNIEPPLEIKRSNE